MAQDQLRQLVRVSNTDIPGSRSLLYGLSKIYGVDTSFSNAICTSLQLDKKSLIGQLTDEQVKKIEDKIKNLEGIPQWLYNRKKDRVSGEDKHIIGPTLKLQNELDVRVLKKVKSYRGMRHAWGLPVRGQRTKGNHRKGKAVGVVKKKQQPQKTGKPKQSSGKGKK